MKHTSHFISDFFKTSLIRMTLFLEFTLVFYGYNTQYSGEDGYSTQYSGEDFLEILKRKLQNFWKS